MGDLSVVEHDPSVEQTTYGVLSDVITVGEAGGFMAKGLS